MKAYWFLFTGQVFPSYFGQICESGVLQAKCPSCHPARSVKAVKGEVVVTVMFIIITTTSHRWSAWDVLGFEALLNLTSCLLQVSGIDLRARKYFIMVHCTVLSLNTFC